jgi:C4-dicarboxylate-specific signal transduction histidine kinase
VTGKKNGAGMGLGLHIASEVMTAQGGNISFPEPGDYEIPADFAQGAIVVLSLKK